MPGEPRLATRAPDGQVLLEYDRFPADAARGLEADLKRALGGSLDFSAQARALYATDASNYRQVPIGLVTPRSRDEVVEALRICREHDAPILSRGGGTSLAGQGCNVAVCIDFSTRSNGGGPPTMSSGRPRSPTTGWNSSSARRATTGSPD
jgi:hypothetical protein